MTALNSDERGYCAHSIYLYCSENLKNDKEIIHAAVKKQGYTILSVPTKFLQDETLVLEHDRNVINLLPEKLRNNLKYIDASIYKYNEMYSKQLDFFNKYR